MTGRQITVQRISRLFLTFALAAGALWVAPLPQPVLAAPAPAPASAPAAAPVPAPAAAPAAAPALGLLPAPVPNIIVATTTIADDPNDGQCDLWEALQAVFQANFDLSPTYHECTAIPHAPNVIGFSGAAAGGTILIPSNVNSGDLPFVWGDTTLLGPVTIKPSTTNTETHMLEMAGDANLTLISVSLSGGHTSGGGAAILDLNHATVNLYGSNITGNIADNDGGAINSDGNVNVVLSNFSGNEALGIQSGTGFGGAINITGAGTLSIAKSNFAGNTAKAGGGALYSTTPNGTIEDSLFSGNIGGQDINLNKGGGAIYNDVSGAMAIARTQFAGNLAPQGNGGALYNNSGATLVVTDTTFAANLAGDFSHAMLGGAIYEQGSLTIYRSSFANNIAVAGDGGGLVVDRHGVADVANSTFALNGAPSGLGAGLVVTQTQIGGPASTLNLLNDTIADNGTPTKSDAGVYNAPGQNLSLGNTILDGNLNSNCAGPGTYTSLGHNLDSGHTCQLPNSNGNLIDDSHADLGGPSFNGGPLSSMLTMKPGNNFDPSQRSHAIDAGDDAICAGPLVGNQDQRGETRPKDGSHLGTNHCDIGAYEADTLSPGFGSDPSEPATINVGSAALNTTVTATLVLSNTGEWPLTIQPVAPIGSGDFSVSLLPITILPHAAPVNFVISCKPTSTGSRTAALGFGTNDTPLHAAVGFLIKCTGFNAPAPGFNSSPIPPGPITFPNTVTGGSSNQSIQVIETGDATLNVTSAALGGPDAAQFSILTSVPFSIANGGAPHDVTVQCHPTSLGLLSATLTLNTNDTTQSSVVYNLSCKAVPQPSPFLVPGSSIGNSPDHGLNGVFGVAVSPNGKYVYATSNTDGRVSSFDRNPVSGALSFTNWIHDGFFFSLNSAILLALSPDGNNAYVAGQAYNIIDKLTADPATGAMSFLNVGLYPRSDLGGAHGVAVSPDGRSVYATGAVSNSVIVFTRNLTSGNLTYTQSIISVAEVGGAEGLTVSPDGQNVYVTGYVDTSHGTLEVFKRSTADGKLSHVQTRSEGDSLDGNILHGLKGAYQVSVSSDGQNVYAAGSANNAIVAFSRNPVDGSLHWLATYLNGAGGITGLQSPLGIDTTPDGLHVVASGFLANAVAVFDRDPANGFLTFNQEIQRNGSGVPPLAGALDVRSSPDSRNIYVAAYSDSAIAVLQAANLVPVIDNINPAGVLKDTASVVMTVNGSNFVPGAFVKVGVVNQPATYVNSHQLQVDMSSYVHSVGPVTIKAFNPSPGGGLSNGVTFTVNDVGQNPVPAIDHITPQGQSAGGITVTLDVYGTNFINASTVLSWNNVSLAPNVLNGGHLQVTIPQSYVSQPGTSAVRVFNPGPGGGPSNAVAFTVAQPGQNAVPSLTGINPPWVFSFGAASKQIQVTVTGQNFIQGSTVRLDGANRPTLFVDSSHLKVTIYGSDLAVPASTALTVFTPGPGGGTSNPLTFVIKKLYRRLLPFVKR